MNRQVVSFLSLFGLVLVLSVYYILLPTNLFISVPSTDKEVGTILTPSQDVYFETLFTELDAKHQEVIDENLAIVVSSDVTNQQKEVALNAILSEKEIEGILKKYGITNTYRLYKIPYKQYQNKLTKKLDMHYEYIFYIKKEKMSNKQPQVYFYVPYADVLQVRKDEEKYTYANGIVSRRKFLKSPLNYIGGKYKLLPQLIEFFPEKINTFVDLFSGGFNVGINVDCNKVICNDMNTFIIDLYKELYSKPIDETLNKITGRINEYGLSKENEEAFKKFRDYYNKTKEPIDLYTLSCYSFNYQFRFNNNKEYNNPFGTEVNFQTI